MIMLGDHPGASRLLSTVESLFKREGAFFSLHQHLSFVCGAQGEKFENGTLTLRSQFLQYLNDSRGKHHILPILAEAAIDELLRASRGEILDLAVFESIIAEIVDSVVLFPESPGSFAELGFFAAHDAIARKTLVVAQQQHQGQSFINLGPIPIFNKHSIYGPIPIILGKETPHDFKHVVDRLEFQTSKQKYRDRYEHGEFKNHTKKVQLTILYELIRVFSFVTEKNLLLVLTKVFGKYEIEIVRRLLAILVSMQFVSRTEFGDYLTKKDSPSLMEFKGSKFEETKAQILLFYENHDREAFAAVEAL